MLIRECIKLAKEANKMPALIPIHKAAKVPVFLKEERKRLKVLCAMFENEFEHLQQHFKEKLKLVDAAIGVYEAEGCLH